MNSLRKYLMEFIGTFFLVFTVGAVSLYGVDGGLSAIAIGLVLAVMVYSGGSVSGGHYNPAVSLAAALRGAMGYKDMFLYWIFQLLGGTCAAITALWLIPHGIITSECTYDTMQIITGEFLFTFALCYTVLSVATSEKTAGNSYFGLAIGGIVTAGAITVGGILCPGAFNPAVAMGLGVLGTTCLSTLWIVAASNLLAGIIAALMFKFISKE